MYELIYRYGYLPHVELRGNKVIAFPINGNPSFVCYLYENK